MRLSNVFWYFLGYGLVMGLAMRGVDKNRKKKVLTYTPSGNGLEKFCSVVSIATRYLVLAVSLFIPVSRNPVILWIGSALYGIGLLLTTLAMVQFTREDLDRPIITGLYKASRNPMQVMYFVMEVGIALVAGNVWLWMLVLVNIASSYTMFFMQERYCLNRYGTEYADYMAKTPRVLLIKPRNI